MTASLVERIWARDVTVWGDPDTPEIADRLGWLDLPATMAGSVRAFTAFADEVRQQVDRIVLCGMGGSSLAPEVLWRTFGRREGYPSFQLLDTIHPDAVAAVRDTGTSDLFVIASKSGTTMETISLFLFFWEHTGGAAERFVAITDPGTPLAEEARARGVRRVFEAAPDVGGRYAALSPFGLVPAALIGVDVTELLARARLAAAACRRAEPTNFWLRLGRRLGEAGRDGRDKITFVLSPRVESLGLWLDQLLAESTGKNGAGLVPITGERPDVPERYGEDRVFVRIGILNDLMVEEDQDLTTLDHAGHPVLRTDLDDPYDLGAEFFGWQFATAVAGHVLGVHPFDQPNVAESKRNTAARLAGGGQRIPAGTAAEVERLLGGVGPGDYLAVLAFAAPSPATDRRLRRLQRGLRHRTPGAVTVAYGPRYLHSTGQLHKGGPETGHFLQIVDPASAAVGVRVTRDDFGTLMAAQADGDLEALRARQRPAVRVEGWSALESYLG